MRWMISKKGNCALGFAGWFNIDVFPTGKKGKNKPVFAACINMSARPIPRELMSTNLKSACREAEQLLMGRLRATYHVINGKRVVDNRAEKEIAKRGRAFRKYLRVWMENKTAFLADGMPCVAKRGEAPAGQSGRVRRTARHGPKSPASGDATPAGA